METMLNIKEKPAADEMVTLLKTLSTGDKQRMKDFLLGVEFAKSTAKNEKRSA